MIEIWKDIKGFENRYQVSNLGNIKSLKNGIILKPQSDNAGKGYLCVNLGKGNHKKIHRLVAETFILNPNNFSEVNHIDGNTKNNRVDNLEWCTHQENCIHFTYKLGQHKGQYKMIPVIITNKYTNQKMKFRSINEAIRWIKNNTKYIKAGEGNIIKVIDNKNKTMYGYKWEREETKI